MLRSRGKPSGMLRFLRKCRRRTPRKLNRYRDRLLGKFFWDSDTFKGLLVRIIIRERHHIPR